MKSSQPVRRGNRACSRASCRKPALRTLTYIYADSTAILGSLATFAEPHAYDLCLENGEVGPNSDDIMAIADAVREVGSMRAEQSPATPTPNHTPIGQEIGRRGHLRAIPSQ